MIKESQNTSVRGTNMNGQGSGQQTMISDNPVFKFKVRSLSNGNEQPNDNGEDNKNINRDKNSNFKIGDIINGNDFKGKNHKGKIVDIEKDDDGNISSVIIIDTDDNKKLSLEPASCQIKKNDNNQNETKKCLLNLEDFIF